MYDYLTDFSPSELKLHLVGQSDMFARACSHVSRISMHTYLPLNSHALIQAATFRRSLGVWWCWTVFFVCLSFFREGRFWRWAWPAGVGQGRRGSPLWVTRMNSTWCWRGGARPTWPPWSTAMTVCGWHLFQVMRKWPHFVLCVCVGGGGGILSLPPNPSFNKVWEYIYNTILCDHFPPCPNDVFRTAMPFKTFSFFFLFLFKGSFHF